MAQILSTYQISKSFAGKDLFKNVSFGIEATDKAALLGPNGVGKSTLLKILAKKIQADSGDVTYQKGTQIGFLEQTPTFTSQDTIASFLLDNYNLDGDLLASAYEWIARLELNAIDEACKIQDLSGGWQKRVALAKQLIKKPQFLILDEPTNHLDVTTIKWLEDFIKECPFAVLLVTHDRLFLQRTCNKILDLDPRFPNQILSVQGDYQKYLETKYLMISNQQVREKKLANTLRREKEWLSRGAQARQTKQKARMEEAGNLEQQVNTLRQLNSIKNFNLDFKSNEKGPQKLIICEKLGKKSFQDKNQWLFQDVNLILTVKSRIALLGANGVGKSTFIKTILGQLKPDHGSVRQAEDFKIAYFEQNRDTLILQKSILHNICPEGDYVNYRGQYVHVRSYLERFGFYKEKIDLPVSQLSGGEQARLRIAQLMLQECKILVLDEPTNDLDIETLDSLEEAIKEFDGAVLLVTHDRYFMDQVAKQILSFSPFPGDNGEILSFADYLQWEEWYEKRNEMERKKTKQQEVFSSNQSKLQSRKLSFKEKFELEHMEENIAKTEHAIKALQSELQSSEISADAGKISALYSQLSTHQEKLVKMFARWHELEELNKIK